MKQRLSFLVICLSLLFPYLAHGETPVRRGLFVMVIQEPPVLCSRTAILELVAAAKNTHCSTIFIQIYRANQAWYASSRTDASPYQRCITNLSEDPLKLLLREAHRQGIEVHAWLNMLSLSKNKDAPILKKYGPEILTRNLKKKAKLEDYTIDNQYFLEPGDLRVRQELAEIVQEILLAYPDLDGIQFDYIRYPDKNPAYGFTAANTERFKEATGVSAIDEKSKAWQEWKRTQVTETLAYLVKTARAIRPDIRVSATGCMPFSRAYYEAFQDWPSWINNNLVDFVTIMDYSPDPQEFSRWIRGSKDKVHDSKKMNIAVGAYKLTHSLNEFEQEMQSCEEADAGMCVVFHYGSLQESPGLSGFLGGKKMPKQERE